MTKTKKRMLLLSIPIAFILILAGLAIWVNQAAQFGFSREIPEKEQALRLELVSAAEQWLGANEADNSHKAIIDRYNAHKPLAEGYVVKYTDEWCATFVSAAAIATELTGIIPTECGCERQIHLFMGLGAWEERDDYTPLPGDIIYYCISDLGIGDSVRWSDHVGIVVGTWGPFIKVIEGNIGSRVAYRYIPINAPTIRGYGLPDYASIVNKTPMD